MRALAAGKRCVGGCNRNTRTSPISATWLSTSRASPKSANYISVSFGGGCHGTGSETGEGVALIAVGLVLGFPARPCLEGRNKVEREREMIRLGVGSEAGCVRAS